MGPARPFACPLTSGEALKNRPDQISVRSLRLSTPDDEPALMGLTVRFLRPLIVELGGEDLKLKTMLNVECWFGVGCKYDELDS